MKPIPQVKIVIAHESSTLFLYEDGVIGLGDKNSWTEFYDNGKTRKFLNEDPVGGYFFAAKSYDGPSVSAGGSLDSLMNLVKKHAVISAGGNF
jgi:hypothetical protein